MLNILYTLIIFPIEQIIEICFFYGTTWFRSLGVSILGVSVAVSTAILPIYLMADAQQRLERETEKRLEKGVNLIKSVFTGDERFMLLSTYYRQNSYHPIYALRNSIDLLIQIPFFIAAYHFLSHLEILKGAPFLFINDLGSPDKLLFGANLLPIVMTVINVVSGMIYAKGLKSKDKIQLYAMSGVFLVLLYNSPAGLVLYWTSNNIYNLIKNIVQSAALKGRRPQAAGGESPSLNVIKPENALNDSKTFVLAALALALLIGLVIPSGVISSSVEEFAHSTTGSLVSPLRFVVNTMFQAGGFLLWGAALFFLFGARARRILTTAAVSLLIMSVMDTFVYWKNYGFLTCELVLNNYYKPWPSEQNRTLLVILALSAAAYILMRIRWKQIIASLLFIAVVSFAVYGVVNIIKINTQFAEMSKSGAVPDNEIEGGVVEKAFTFSRNGRNVFVLIMDRMQGQHIPFIFSEKPELAKSFSGFINYPNTVSFSGHTVGGGQVLMGGYYYTPSEIQKRKGEKLKEKYDEGFQVLPRIMAQNGFETVAANLPFWVETEEYAARLFADAQNIRAKDVIGKYLDQYYRGRISLNGGEGVKTADYEPVIKKNLIQFSLFKCSPYAMRTKVYNYGNYMNVVNKNQISGGGYTRELLENYISLSLYPRMTEFTDGGGGFSAALNNLVHAPVFLQYPDYELASLVTNRGNGIFANDPQYHVTVLSFILIAKWFDYLKENGVWDNTRIIIASDHGYLKPRNLIPENIPIPNGEYLQRFNSALMVKDFGAAGELSFDSTFMTSADVPSIAVKDIIENPVNPFTGEPLYTDKAGGVNVMTTHWIPRNKHGEYGFTVKDDEWLRVKDNIFIKENWSAHKIEK